MYVSKQLATTISEYLLVLLVIFRHKIPYFTSHPAAAFSNLIALYFMLKVRLLDFSMT